MYRREDDVTLGPEEAGCEGEDWSQQAEGRVQLSVLMNKIVKRVAHGTPEIP
jgi:hypothetical protein